MPRVPSTPVGTRIAVCTGTAGVAPVPPGSVVTVSPAVTCSDVEPARTAYVRLTEAVLPARSRAVRTTVWVPAPWVGSGAPAATGLPSTSAAHDARRDPPASSAQE